MGAMTHAAGRMAFSAAIDVALKDVRKNREEGIVKLVDLMEKYMSDEKMDVNYDTVRNMIRDKDCTLNQYMNRIIDEIDPHVLKTTALNLGYEAFFYGTKTIRKMREVHQCNVPWLILMDPTSACNLRCTGCWAAEYGHQLNLSLETIDSIVKQGKKLGTYMYIYTGGEPLVRKQDLIKICEMNPDCEFLSFRNGTLIDEEFCQEMLRVKNFVPAISLEGFEDANDGRRGDGVFQKVQHAMKLLKSHKLPFGISTCYTSRNFEDISSEAFYDMMIESGALFVWYFHYMPVGNSAVPELLPTPQQREEMYKRIRHFRETKAIFGMDFQNDGQFVGGCIAGGRRYLHINAKGDVEPCVFIHYSNVNIHDCTLLEALKSPIFQAYHDNQPFNDNMLRPCPMLENPDKLGEMVKESKAVNTDYQSPETPEHLKEKAAPYAENWTPTAEKLWNKEKEKIAAGKAGVEQ
mgnify:CR=1 FL=1